MGQLSQLGTIMATRRDEYERTRGAVFRLRYHLIWCVKRRRKVLVGPIRGRLAALIRTKCAEFGYTLDAVGVSADHVHVLLGLPPAVPICEVARRLKGYTSRVLRMEYPSLRGLPCLWSPSYFAKSVGGEEGVTKRYVEGQK